MCSCLYLLFTLARSFCRTLSFSDCHPCFHYCILFCRISDWCLGSDIQAQKVKRADLLWCLWCIAIEHFFSENASLFVRLVVGVWNWIGWSVCIVKTVKRRVSLSVFIPADGYHHQLVASLDTNTHWSCDGFLSLFPFCYCYCCINYWADDENEQSQSALVEKTASKA